MKKICLSIVIISLIFTAFQCCTGKSGKSRKPVSSISLSPAKNSYKAGEALTISVNTKIHDGALKDVKVYLNNELISTSAELSVSQKVENLTLLGQNNIRVVAEKKDGVSNSRSQNFLVLSDIEPKQYDYKVINEHPHNTEHFTQGFEFHNGFLYEGTGELGHSGIFKTDKLTGKILQSHKMDDRYFGEGITILNDKLYQLTYKSKKGFVYNVADFAVIDSFRFDSPEGWGLTNDGKSLIMSDGSSVLTWLNPDDFSVIKKITVADNKQEWKYLNELEYVDGIIWANIWTSTVIVAIDAETGKVLGKADLDGILSIMHKSELERIDVLNGIAHNPENQHFYVTGKLWPKTFEIEIKK